jgi:hypothetical protein
MLLEERLYRVQHSDGRNEKEQRQQQENACLQDGQERQLQKQELLALQAAAEAAVSVALDQHRALDQRSMLMMQQQQQLGGTSNCGTTNYFWANLSASMHNSSSHILHYIMIYKIYYIYMYNLLCIFWIIIQNIHCK